MKKQLSKEPAFDLSELEKLTFDVYNLIDKKYQKEFESLSWGCHCSPATEWYGDVFSHFSKILKNDIIKDETIKKQMEIVLKHFSKWFGIPSF